MALKVKRIYERRERDDGKRILVDRLWPRGLTKEKADVDEWMRDIAPSDELRKWFGHREDRWEAFRKKYFEELDARSARVMEIVSDLGEGNVTLLYSSKEGRFNNAHALEEYLQKLQTSGGVSHAEGKRGGRPGL